MRGERLTFVVSDLLRVRCRSRQIDADPGKYAITTTITLPLIPRRNSRLGFTLRQMIVGLRSRRLEGSNPLARRAGGRVRSLQSQPLG